MRQLINLFIRLCLHPFKLRRLLDLYKQLGGRAIEMILLLFIIIIDVVNLELRRISFIGSIITISVVVRSLVIEINLEPIVDLVDLVEHVELKWVPLEGPIVALLLLAQVHPLLPVEF